MKEVSLYFPTFAVMTILHSYSRRDPYHDKERIGFMTESRMFLFERKFKTKLTTFAFC